MTLAKQKTNCRSRAGKKKPKKTVPRKNYIRKESKNEDEYISQKKKKEERSTR